MAKTADQRLDQIREIMRSRARESRQIGPIPEHEDKALRAECDKSLRRWCEVCQPNVFRLGWGEDLVKALGVLERCVKHGGLFAFALPRSSGKTSLCRAAALWSVLTGRHQFVLLCGATHEMARLHLEAMLTTLLHNEDLYRIYPEVCHCFRRTEGEPRRCPGQELDGEKTGIYFGKDRINFPRIGSKSDGCVLYAKSIGAASRGLNIMRADGTPMRPSLIIPDDPQTDRVAGSMEQSASLVELIHGTLCGLADNSRPLSVAIPCTVIAQDDASSMLLDRKAHPDWQGFKGQLVYGWPKNWELWQQYKEIRDDSLASNGDISAATEYYQANQAAMDEGARAAWPELMKPPCVSALQHAMELFFRDERSFRAEYQNDPMAESGQEAARLSPADVCRRLSGLPRAEVPADATRVIVAIDVGARTHLHWLVLAVADDFTGSVIDYGVERVTLDREENTDVAVAVAARDLLRRFARAKWQDADGVEHIASMIGIDAAYQGGTLYQVILENKDPRIFPVKGVGITPGGVFRVAGGRVATDGFRRVPVRKLGCGTLRQIEVHSNQWKSFAHARMTMPVTQRGAVTLFGASSAAHGQFAIQLSAERRTVLLVRNRYEDKWEKIPNVQNHWGDAFYVACSLACAAGCRLGIQNQVSITRKQATDKAFSDADVVDESEQPEIPEEKKRNAMSSISKQRNKIPSAKEIYERKRKK